MLEIIKQGPIRANCLDHLIHRQKMADNIDTMILILGDKAALVEFVDENDCSPLRGWTFRIAMLDKPVDKFVSNFSQNGFRVIRVVREIQSPSV